jgi:hypothetical protein
MLWKHFTYSVHLTKRSWRTNCVPFTIDMRLYYKLLALVSICWNAGECKVVNTNCIVNVCMLLSEFKILVLKVYLLLISEIPYFMKCKIYICYPSLYLTCFVEIYVCRRRLLLFLSRDLNRLTKDKIPQETDLRIQ